MVLEADNCPRKHSATLGQQLEALAAANADGLLEWVLSFTTQASSLTTRAFSVTMRTDYYDKTFFSGLDRSQARYPLNQAW